MEKDLLINTTPAVFRSLVVLYKSYTWTPKACATTVFWVLLNDFGPYFWGSGRHHTMDSDKRFRVMFDALLGCRTPGLPACKNWDTAKELPNKLP